MRKRGVRRFPTLHGRPPGARREGRSLPAEFPNSLAFSWFSLNFALIFRGSPPGSDRGAGIGTSSNRIVQRRARARVEPTRAVISGWDFRRFPFNQYRRPTTFKAVSAQAGVMGPNSEQFGNVLEDVGDAAQVVPGRVRQQTRPTAELQSFSLP